LNQAIQFALRLVAAENLTHNLFYGINCPASDIHFISHPQKKKSFERRLESWNKISMAEILKMTQMVSHYVNKCM